MASRALTKSKIEVGTILKRFINDNSLHWPSHFHRGSMRKLQVKKKSKTKIVYVLLFFLQGIAGLTGPAGPAGAAGMRVR